eukprot:gnl/TRDRNA2_/TRDRNA2_169160_c5_seq1.p1 gnl/TRDRNA2_/TRDRNA2_169160_c5~~gnl/TRDRNA2_/TRDRNA2_169160_c5_seq1.p1  ORF type:complete len:764 (+),score=123.13 gnl/TRDRNA2_/TRDRNA2_169160_c5_seq1:264-2294(+)
MMEASGLIQFEQQTDRSPHHAGEAVEWTEEAPEVEEEIAMPAPRDLCRQSGSPCAPQIGLRTDVEASADGPVRSRDLLAETVPAANRHAEEEDEEVADSKSDFCYQPRSFSRKRNGGNGIWQEAGVEDKPQDSTHTTEKSTASSSATGETPPLLHTEAVVMKPAVSIMPAAPSSCCAGFVGGLALVTNQWLAAIRSEKTAPVAQNGMRSDEAVASACENAASVPALLSERPWSQQLPPISALTVLCDNSTRAPDVLPKCVGLSEAPEAEQDAKHSATSTSNLYTGTSQSSWPMQVQETDAKSAVAEAEIKAARKLIWDVLARALFRSSGRIPTHIPSISMEKLPQPMMLKPAEAAVPVPEEESSWETDLDGLDRNESQHQIAAEDRGALRVGEVHAFVTRSMKVDDSAIKTHSTDYLDAVVGHNMQEQTSGFPSPRGWWREPWEPIPEVEGGNAPAVGHYVTSAPSPGVSRASAVTPMSEASVPPVPPRPSRQSHTNLDQGLALSAQRPPPRLGIISSDPLRQDLSVTADSLRQSLPVTGVGAIGGSALRVRGPLHRPPASMLTRAMPPPASDAGMGLQPSPRGLMPPAQLDKAADAGPAVPMFGQSPCLETAKQKPMLGDRCRQECWEARVPTMLHEGTKQVLTREGTVDMASPREGSNIADALRGARGVMHLRV